MYKRIMMKKTMALILSFFLLFTSLIVTPFLAESRAEARDSVTNEAVTVGDNGIVFNLDGLYLQRAIEESEAKGKTIQLTDIDRYLSDVDDHVAQKLRGENADVYELSLLSDEVSKDIAQRNISVRVFSLVSPGDKEKDYGDSDIVFFLHNDSGKDITFTLTKDGEIFGEPVSLAANADEGDKVAFLHYTLDELERRTYTASSEDAGVVVTTSRDAFDRPVTLKVDRVYWSSQNDSDVTVLDDKQREVLIDQGSTEENSLSYDIRFVDEQGEEVEPSSRAVVQFSVDADALRDKKADPESLTVSHLKEENGDYEAQTVANSKGHNQSDMKAVRQGDEISLAEAAEVVEENQKKTTEDEAKIRTRRSTEDESDVQSGEEGQFSYKKLRDDVEAVRSEFVVDGFSIYTVTWNGYNDGRTTRSINPLQLHIHWKLLGEDGNISDANVPSKSYSFQTTSAREEFIMNTYYGFAKYAAVPDGYTYISSYIIKDGKSKRIATMNSYVGAGSSNYMRVITDEGREEWLGDGYLSPDIYVLLEDIHHPPTVDTVDTSKDIRISMFDYNPGNDVDYNGPNSVNQLINRGHTLKFFNGTTNHPYFGNNYNANEPQRGILKNKLGADGYPVLSNGESLSYLFGNKDLARGINRADRNLNHLFYRDDEGYLAYDSARYFATLDDGDRSDVFLDKRDNNFRLYNRRANGQINFLPYNDISASGKLNTTPNFWNGTLIDTTIVQPLGGQIDHNGQNRDMVFEFNGDDDLWVFIDDTLVLDLGGIHGAMTCTINFANGEVRTPSAGGGEQVTYIGDIMRAAGRTTGFSPNGRTFADYTNHTMRIVYFERGAGLSNLRVRMNLQTVPERHLYLGKQVTGKNIPTDPNVPYNFLVEMRKYNGRDYSAEYAPYSGPYSVWKGDIANPSHATKVRDENTENGRVSLLDGEFIMIDEAGIKSPKDLYRLTEYVEEANKTYNELYDVVSNVSVVRTARIDNPDDGTEVQGYQISDMEVGKAPVVLFKNNIQAKNLGYLVIDKELRGRADPNETYTMNVTINGEAFTGKYELFEAGDTSYSKEKTVKQQMTGGRLQLKAGQKAVIRNILWKTDFTVGENTQSLDNSVYNPPVYFVTVNDPTGGTETEVENTELQNGAVSGSIPLSKNGNVIVKVQNSKIGEEEEFTPPPTGIRTQKGIFVLMLVIGAGCALFLLIGRRTSGKKYRRM